jgi:ankyrin repeat protein
MAKAMNLRRDFLLALAFLMCGSHFICQAQPVQSRPAGDEWMTSSSMPTPIFDSVRLRAFVGDLQCNLSQNHGRLFAAESEVAELTKVFPNDALSWAAKSELEMRAVEIDCDCGSSPALAVELADKAVAMAPDALMPHLTAAKAHMAVGDFATAREEMRSAVKAGAAKADIATIEAFAARMRGDDKANIKWLAPVVGQIDQSAPQALAYASLGDSYRSLGQKAEAEDMYRKGAALQSCVTAPQLSLSAFLLFEKADVDGAQSILRNVMQRLPNAEVQRQLSVSDYYRWASGRESKVPKERLNLGELAQSAYASPDEVFVDAARYPSGNPLLRKLLSAKVLRDVNTRDAEANTALIKSGLGNNLAGAVFLLANKADVDAENKRGQRALGFFAAGGNADAVRLLLDHHAELKYLDRNGESPLSLAVRGGHVDIVKLLLRSKSANSKLNHATAYDATDVSAQLAEAVQQGDRDMILMLLAAHGDINVASEWSMEDSAERHTGNRIPPLIVAILNRDVKTVRLLLDNNANPTIRFHGRSANDYARETGDTEIVALVGRRGS